MARTKDLTTYYKLIPCLILSSFLLFMLGKYFTNANADTEATEIKYDQSTTANTIDKTQMAVKFLSSQDIQKDLLIMRYSNNGSNVKSTGDDDSLQSTVGYYYYRDTEDYFPTMHFNQQSVPIGSSNSRCLHVSWMPYKNRNYIDKYLSIKDQPRCKGVGNEKAHWNFKNPSSGFNFQVWKQKARDVNSAEDCESSEIYKYANIQNNPQSKCFSYQVIESICIYVKYQEDIDQGSYSWVYTGGCYDNGEITNYKQARVGENYYFNEVRIEVRQSADSIVVAKNPEEDDNTIHDLGTFCLYLSVTMIVVALLASAYVAYQHLDHVDQAIIRQNTKRDANPPYIAQDDEI